MPRHKTPRAVRISDGNVAKRPLPPPPVEPFGDLAKPKHLEGYASAMWDEIVRCMPADVYASTDAGVLSAFCVAAALHREAVLRLRVEQVVVPGDKMARVNPWMSILNEQALIMVRLGARLGLDPVARQNLAMKNLDSDSDPYVHLGGQIAS